MTRYFYIVLMLLSFACQYKGQDSGSLVAGHQEVTNSFTVTAPSAGTRKAADVISFTLTHPYAVTVTGTPRLTLTIGGSTVYANYASGTGTKNLVFSYTVAPGDTDTDGIDAAGTVDLNGGALDFTGTAGADTCNTTITVPSLTNVKVDTTAPTVSLATAPSNGTYYLGQSMSFVLTMSEAVTITGTPRLTLTVGATTRYANYSSGSGTTTLIFTSAVVSGDLDSNGISVAAVIDANGGTLRDAGANNATLAFVAPNTASVNVNGSSTVPVISSVTSPANGTYIIGQNMDFILNYSEAVTVTGTPRLALTVGSSTIYANYSSGSGTSALTFRYSISSGDADTDGIAASTTLDNNGGTIVNASSSAASTTVPAQTLTSVIVDGVAPSVASATKPANGTYSTSNVSISFTVTWDDTVTVTGTPRLVITAGSSTVYANYVSGTGTTTLTFTHTIAATDLDLDGIAVSTTIDANGGTLRDANGNDASLTMSSLDTSNVRLNYTGMLAWWDVDDATKVSTVGCTSGTCVNQITDKSGNGVHATATGAAKPQYLSSGFSTGNRAYLRFDEISMVMTASAALNPVRTVFIAFQTEVATMTTQDIFYQSGLTVKTTVASNGNLNLAVVGGYSLNGTALAGSASAFAAGFAANTPYILAVQYGTGYNFTTPMLGATNFGGKIAEVLVYNSALTVAQVAAIVSYLNSKHQVY